MHARHAYITTYMFYEDLRRVQDSLPPQDIYEMLSTKDDMDELCSGADLLGTGEEDDEERKKSEILAQ